MADIYDSSKGLVKIGPCKWSPNLDIAFWLSQKDDTILKVRTEGFWGGIVLECVNLSFGPY